MVYQLMPMAHPSVDVWIGTDLGEDVNAERRLR
jgi:hypothetical protein